MMEGDERATTSDEERLPPAEEDSTSTEQTVRRRPTSLREATKTLRWRRHREVGRAEVVRRPPARPTRFDVERAGRALSPRFQRPAAGGDATAPVRCRAVL
jgi:hypothetical protein